MEILLFQRKITSSSEVFLKLITELAVDESESEYNEGCKVSEEGEGTKRRSAGGDGSGFYLSDLHSCCTDFALFRRIIIMPLGTSAKREETGNNSAAHPLVSFFYNYTSYTQQLGSDDETTMVIAKIHLDDNKIGIIKAR